MITTRSNEKKHPPRHTNSVGQSLRQTRRHEVLLCMGRHHGKLRQEARKDPIEKMVASCTHRGASLCTTSQFVIHEEGHI